MRILSIEDDQTTAKCIELMLSHAGMTVFSTGLGAEGVEAAKAYHYDLVLLDLGLPDIDGFEVLKAVRRAKLTVPIMALTAANDTESKIKFFGLGGDDYLTKPFHREELIARINAIVKRSKELRDFTPPEETP